MDLRKFLDPIWDLVLKRVSKFVIPEFRDTLLVQKITKCGDLLYIGHMDQITFHAQIITDYPMLLKPGTTVMITSNLAPFRTGYTPSRITTLYS